MSIDPRPCTELSNYLHTDHHCSLSPSRPGLELYPTSRVFLPLRHDRGNLASACGTVRSGSTFTVIYRRWELLFPATFPPQRAVHPNPWQSQVYHGTMAIHVWFPEIFVTVLLMRALLSAYSRFFFRSTNPTQRGCARVHLLIIEPSPYAYLPPF